MFKEGSVAFVTGGGSGIGRATAIAFARAGARVCVTDIDLAAAEESAHAAPGDVIAKRLDVTDEQEVVETLEALVRDWGAVDCAFNNAGIRGTTDPAHEMSTAAFRQVIDLNLIGVFLCQREQLKHMYRRGEGAIVNMASTSGFVTTPLSAHYTASKHAVIGLTKAAAFEAAPHGVRVNAVAPGTIETPLNIALAGGEQEMRDRYAPAYPIGRLGLPDEIAEAVLWLCEDRSSFVTGHALVLDGGMLLR